MHVCKGMDSSQEDSPELDPLFSITYNLRRVIKKMKINSVRGIDSRPSFPVLLFFLQRARVDKSGSSSMDYQEDSFQLTEIFVKM
jgi:hypothetical protein